MKKRAIVTTVLTFCFFCISSMCFAYAAAFPVRSFIGEGKARIAQDEDFTQGPVNSVLTFNLNYVASYVLYGDWFSEDDAQNASIPVGSGPHFIVITGINSQTTTIAVGEGVLFYHGEKLLAVDRLTPGAFLEKTSEPIYDRLDISIHQEFSYNNAHVVSVITGGGCWGAPDKARMDCNNHTGKDGCFLSVQISTGRCYEHKADCPDEDGQSTGFWEMATGKHNTWLVTNLPREIINCDDM